jgi:cardiolipin synthase
MFTTLHEIWVWLVGVPHLLTYLTGAYLLYLLGLLGWIILQKREPAGVC